MWLALSECCHVFIQHVISVTLYSVVVYWIDFFFKVVLVACFRGYCKKKVSLMDLSLNILFFTIHLSSSLFSNYGQHVELCTAHGQTKCSNLRWCRTQDGLQVHEGGPPFPGASHGQEEGGVRLVPAAQDLLRHDAEAQVHGTVQVILIGNLSEFACPRNVIQKKISEFVWMCFDICSQGRAWRFQGRDASPEEAERKRPTKERRREESKQEEVSHDCVTLELEL